MTSVYCRRILNRVILIIAKMAVTRSHYPLFFIYISTLPVSFSMYLSAKRAIGAMNSSLPMRFWATVDIMSELVAAWPIVCLTTSDIMFSLTYPWMTVPIVLNTAAPIESGRLFCAYDRGAKMMQSWINASRFSPPIRSQFLMHFVVGRFWRVIPKRTVGYQTGPVSVVFEHRLL